MTQARVWVFYDSVAKLQSNALTQDEAQSTILKIRAHEIGRFYIWTLGWQNWQALRTYLESDQKIFVSTFTISKLNHETSQAVAREIAENTMTITQTQTKTHLPHDVLDKTFAGTHTQTGTHSSVYSHILLSEETMSAYMQQQSEDNGSPSFDADELTYSNIQKPKVDFSKILAEQMQERALRHELKIETLLISPKSKTFRTNTKNISLSGVLLETTIPFEFYDCTFDIVIINTLQTDPRKARVKLQAEAVMNGAQRSQRLRYMNMNTKQKSELQELMQDYLKQIKQPKKKAA